MRCLNSAGVNIMGQFFSPGDKYLSSFTRLLISITDQRSHRGDRIAHNVHAHIDEFGMMKHKSISPILVLRSSHLRRRIIDEARPDIVA